MSLGGWVSLGGWGRREARGGWVSLEAGGGWGRLGEAGLWCRCASGYRFSFRLRVFVGCFLKCVGC